MRCFLDQQSQCGRNFGLIASEYYAHIVPYNIGRAPIIFLISLNQNGWNYIPYSGGLRLEM
jgi:hypothetical protein